MQEFRENISSVYATEGYRRINGEQNLRALENVPTEFAWPVYFVICKTLWCRGNSGIILWANMFDKSIFTRGYKVLWLNLNIRLFRSLP